MVAESSRTRSSSVCWPRARGVVDVARHVAFFLPVRVNRLDERDGDVSIRRVRQPGVVRVSHGGTCADSPGAAAPSRARRVLERELSAELPRIALTELRG